MRLTSGTESYCAALVEYLNKELTFSEIADFKVAVWKQENSWDFQDEGHTHEVQVNEEKCRQYSTSYHRTLEVSRDFRGGWEAALTFTSRPRSKKK